MTQEEFEAVVAESIDLVPQEFLEKIDNVAILVEDEPSPQKRYKLRLRKGVTLFGLYEGVSQLNRGRGYTGVMPDKITIFKNPIERAARDIEDMKKIIKHTVWHEIAHHFGMDESQVRRAEANRLKRLSSKNNGKA